MSGRPRQSAGGTQTLRLAGRSGVLTVPGSRDRPPTTVRQGGHVPPGGRGGGAAASAHSIVCHAAPLSTASRGASLSEGTGSPLTSPFSWSHARRVVARIPKSTPSRVSPATQDLRISRDNSFLWKHCQTLPSQPKTW